jgi:hypothetical protein
LPLSTDRSLCGRACWLRCGRRSERKSHQGSSGVSHGEMSRARRGHQGHRQVPSPWQCPLLSRQQQEPFVDRRSARQRGPESPQAERESLLSPRCRKPLRLRRPLWRGSATTRRSRLRFLDSTHVGPDDQSGRCMSRSIGVAIDRMVDRLTHVERSPGWEPLRYVIRYTTGASLCSRLTEALVAHWTSRKEGRQGCW